MKNVFDAGNEYCKKSTWKDMAWLKFCLISLGVIIGLSIPEGGKTAAYWIAGVVFVVTYVPVMGKFFRILFRK